MGATSAWRFTSLRTQFPQRLAALLSIDRPQRGQSTRAAVRVRGISVASIWGGLGEELWEGVVGGKEEGVEGENMRRCGGVCAVG
jgi:hypothetical protein